MLSQSFLAAGARLRVVAAMTVCVLLAALVRAEEGDFALAPNNPDVLAGIQVSQVLDSAAFATLARQFPDPTKNLDKPLGKQTRLTPRSIDSVFVAGNTTTQEFVVVLNLTEEFELDDVLSAAEQKQPTKIGDFTVYAVEGDQAFCLVDELTIAIGPKKTLISVLKRDADAKVSDELSDAWDNVDQDQHIFVVATLDKLAKQNADAIPAGLPMSPEVLAKVKSATFTLSATKSQLTFGANLDCTDNATANQLKGLLDVVVQGAQQDANLPAEAKQTLKKLKATADDEWLTVYASVGFDVIVAQFKSQIEEAISGEAAE